MWGPLLPWWNNAHKYAKRFEPKWFYMCILKSLSIFQSSEICKNIFGLFHQDESFDHYLDDIISTFWNLLDWSCIHSCFMYVLHHDSFQSKNQTFRFLFLMVNHSMKHWTHIQKPSYACIRPHTTICPYFLSVVWLQLI